MRPTYTPKPLLKQGDLEIWPGDLSWSREVVSERNDYECHNRIIRLVPNEAARAIWAMGDLLVYAALRDAFIENEFPLTHCQHSYDCCGRLYRESAPTVVRHEGASTVVADSMYRNV